MTSAVAVEMAVVPALYRELINALCELLPSPGMGASPSFAEGTGLRAFGAMNLEPGSAYFLAYFATAVS